MEMADTTPDPSPDSLSYEFARKAQDAASAAGDLSKISGLARIVAEDLGGWIDRLAALTCAKPCDLAKAAVLVLGSVFAETLDGPALRVLAGEMARALAEDRRISSVPGDFA